MRASIPRAALMAFGSAFFVVSAGGICAAWLVSLPAQAAEMPLLLFVVTRLFSLPIFLACAVGVLFFGWGLVHFLGQLLFFWRPILEIGPGGVLDRASGISVGFVPWEEVKAVEPFRFRGQRSITILVKDNGRGLLERQNPLKRLLIKANRRYFGTGEITIPLNVLAISDEELAVEIAGYMGLQGEARERLRFRQEVDALGEEVRPERTRTRSALRIAKSVARWTAVAVLSLFYYMVSVGLVLPGVALLWNSVGPGSAPGLDHPLIGAVLLVLGILFFVFFPRLVKRLTGREVLSTPYY